MGFARPPNKSATMPRKTPAPATIPPMRVTPSPLLGAADAHPGNDAKPKHVVLLDDCPSMRRHYGNALRDRGILVTDFKHPVKFLEAAQAGQLGNIDMFILDVMLTQGGALPVEETDFGDLEGIRLAQWLQRESGYSKVPVVLATASPFSSIVSSARNAVVGLNSAGSCNCIFIQKTDYSTEELAELVADYFANGSFRATDLGLITWLANTFFKSEM